jgi:hypothetical protein
MAGLAISSRYRHARHGRFAAPPGATLAHAIREVSAIESQVAASTGLEFDPPQRTLRIKQRKSRSPRRERRASWTPPNHPPDIPANPSSDRAIQPAHSHRAGRASNPQAAHLGAVPAPAFTQQGQSHGLRSWGLRLPLSDRTSHCTALVILPGPRFLVRPACERGVDGAVRTRPDGAVGFASPGVTSSA